MSDASVQMVDNSREEDFGERHKYLIVQNLDRLTLAERNEFVIAKSPNRKVAWSATRRIERKRGGIRQRPSGKILHLSSGGERDPVLPPSDY